MRRIYQSRLLLSTLHRPISTSAAAPPPPPPPPKPTKPLVLPRALSRVESQFESWITNLKPGFSPSDVDKALKAQSDPELALDIFRWTSQRPSYKHTPQTYLTMLQILASTKRLKHVQTLVEEVLAGACAPHLELFNYMIRICCGHRELKKRAYDLYKKMLNSKDCKPTLETYEMLLKELGKKFGKFPINYVYLNSVQLLSNQMKACGVTPNLRVLNYIIEAYSKSLVVDEALRLLREMRLYGVEPDEQSYSSVIRAMCEKERVDSAWDLFKEMREKCLIPYPRVHMILVCSLAMDKRFDDGIEVMFDMIENGVFPDFLTYKTLLEEMCRDGRQEETLDLLEQFKKRDISMDRRSYGSLLDILHFNPQ